MASILKVKDNEGNVIDIPVMRGATGPTGPAGPNRITSDTNTDFNGMLVGDGENVSSVDVLPVSMGGTGASDAAGARSNLGAVPASRTINGKALSGNITLAASDVSAIPTSQKGAANGVAALEANAKVVATHATSLVVSQTDATINVTENMNGRFFYVNNANAVTVVLPDPASVPSGFEAEFVQWGTGTVTFQLDSSLSGKYLFSLDSARQIAGRYGVVVVKQISASSWLLAGALA